MTSPAGERWRLAATVLSQFVIGAVWILAGISKWALPDSFLDAIREHGLIRIEGFVPVALIGTSETVLGVLVLVLGTRRYAGPIVIGLSAMTLLALSLYLTQVPTEAIKTAGCGCGILPQLETRSYNAALSRNVLLLIVHVVAAFPLNRRSGMTTQTLAGA